MHLVICIASSIPGSDAAFSRDELSSSSKAGSAQAIVVGDGSTDSVSL